MGNLIGESGGFSGGNLKGVFAATLLLSGGFGGDHVFANDIDPNACEGVAETIKEIQACFNLAASDPETWYTAQLKEGIYTFDEENGDDTLTLTAGQVRLVGAGRVVDATTQYNSAPSLETTADQEALDRAWYYVLDGEYKRRILHVSGQDTKLYIQGISFVQGDAYDIEGGGALLFDGYAIGIAHSVFAGNLDSAISMTSQTNESIINSFFRENIATRCYDETMNYKGGAITAREGEFEVYDSTFYLNVGCYGGAIWGEASEFEIEDSTFSNNQAIHGGAVYFASGTSGPAKIIRSTITQNRAKHKGGGVYFEPFNVDWSFHGNILSGNFSDDSSQFWGRDCYLEGYPPNYIAMHRIEQNILGRINERGEYYVRVNEEDTMGDCSFLLIAQPENMPKRQYVRGGFRGPDGRFLDPNGNLYENPGKATVINGEKSGTWDPELEDLAFNGNIGLQLPTHLPKANSVSTNRYDTYNDISYDFCNEQRFGTVSFFDLFQSGSEDPEAPKCAAGATQRLWFD